MKNLFKKEQTRSVKETGKNMPMGVALTREEARAIMGGFVPYYLKPNTGNPFEGCRIPLRCGPL